jgi:hypothetical protein
MTEDNKTGSHGWLHKTLATYDPDFGGPINDDFQRGYLAALVESAHQLTNIDMECLMGLLRWADLRGKTSLWR